MNHSKKLLIAKYIVSLGVLAFFWQIFFPTVAYALTEGPAQPEQESFMPINVSDMVDPFSGSFQYNLPIFEVPGPHGGYPINIFYGGPPSMDQEASCVGLGWNLNLGNISRSLQGLPDNFKGDVVKEEHYSKQDTTEGISLGGGAPQELFGFPIGNLTTGGGSVGSNGPSLGLTLGIGNLGIYRNNYRGYGVQTSFNANLGFSYGLVEAGVGANMSFNSQTGVGLNPSLSLGLNFDGVSSSINYGVGISSKEGLTHHSYGFNISKGFYGIPVKKDASIAVKSSAGIGGSAIIYYGSQFSAPVKSSTVSKNNLIGLVAGRAPLPFYFRPLTAGTGNLAGGQLIAKFLNINLGTLSIDGYRQTSGIRDNKLDLPVFGYMYSHADEANRDQDMLDIHRANDQVITKYSRHLPVPKFNNDFIAIKGHATGGVFRAYQSNHGVLPERNVERVLEGGEHKFEGGFGSQLNTNIHIGYN